MLNFKFLNKTFNSCVAKLKDHHHHHTRPSHQLNSICTSTSKSDDFFSSDTHDSSEETSSVTSPPDFATVFASQRFFFSSPGPSNSIFDTKLLPECDTLIAGAVPTSTYSPNPYLDFRRSMQEMVDSKSDSLDIKADWDWLHELLLCYLALNSKCTHKYVLEAFADLVVSLMTRSSSSESDTHLLEAEIPKCLKRSWQLV